MPQHHVPREHLDDDWAWTCRFRGVWAWLSTLGVPALLMLGAWKLVELVKGLL